MQSRNDVESECSGQAGPSRRPRILTEPVMQGPTWIHDCRHCFLGTPEGEIICNLRKPFPDPFKKKLCRIHPPTTYRSVCQIMAANISLFGIPETRQWTVYVRSKSLRGHGEQNAMPSMEPSVKIIEG